MIYPIGVSENAAYTPTIPNPYGLMDDQGKCLRGI
jgi:hypothetical protein